LLLILIIIIYIYIFFKQLFTLLYYIIKDKEQTKIMGAGSFMKNGREMK